MTNGFIKIPFVDLSLQHQPLQSQLEAVLQQAIQRGDFVLGQTLAEFESAFATACGVRYGIGVACGTEAIALGLQASGIVPGDRILIPANTFIATVIGVLRAQAQPILVDCDLQTGLMDLKAAETAIDSNTKAILPVHLYGQMVSPNSLLDLAHRYNLIVFEDAAQAHLAEREGYRAGSVGLATAFSFYPSKNLGAFGDGGMLITNCEEIAQKMRVLRNYGAPNKYLHTEVGTNSRLDSLQAAILQVKLPYLAKWNRDRYIVAQHYDRLLEPLQEKGIIPIQNHSGSGHSYHLYAIRVTEESPCDRDLLQERLTLQGIGTGIHYPLPCHLQPAYQHLGKPGDFPNAEILSRQVLSLPMYPGLSHTQIEQVVSAIQFSLSS